MKCKANNCSSYEDSESVRDYPLLSRYLVNAFELCLSIVVSRLKLIPYRQK